MGSWAAQYDNARCAGPDLEWHGATLPGDAAAAQRARRSHRLSWQRTRRSSTPVDLGALHYSDSATLATLTNGSVSLIELKHATGKLAVQMPVFCCAAPGHHHEPQTDLVVEPAGEGGLWQWQWQCGMCLET